MTEMTDAELDGLLARLDDEATRGGLPAFTMRCLAVAAAAIRQLRAKLANAYKKCNDTLIHATNAEQYLNGQLSAMRADNEALRLAALAVQEACAKIVENLHPNASVSRICEDIRALELDPLTEGRKYREQVRREAILSATRPRNC